MKTKRVTDPIKQEEIYRQRYKIVVERDKDAPADLYPDGMLKDKCDTKALQVACYESSDDTLLGFLTVVLKTQDTDTLPIEEQHELSVEKNTAEIMRLVISDKMNIKFRGHILKHLLKEVEQIIAEYNLTKLYLVTTKNAQKLYTRLGFKQIGPFRLYKGISDECPMTLEITKVNKKLF